MITRRQFGRVASGLIGGLAVGRLPLPAEADEWVAIQQAFPVDRSLIHLNNGGVCPAPMPVLRALTAHQAEANRRPYFAHEREIKPQLESVRRRLASVLGCNAEEVALTRNASEGMEICQLGMDLRRGDEIVTTEHDYPRMLNTWEQRAAREGIVIRKVPVSVPLGDPGELVAAIDEAITSRTRMVMMCHMVDLTGQILPVRAVADAAHRRGVPVLVDGAQTFGHFPFTMADLGCDFFATSLHKWLSGPEGTGLLYVKRDRIPEIWPLTPSKASLKEDIRKFEDVGIRCHAAMLAVGEALAFHAGIGAKKKHQRLCALRDYWLDALGNHSRVRLLTNLEAAGALATVAIDGMDHGELRNHLWDAYRVRVRPIDQVNVRGIRVSPAIYNTHSELDRFVSVMGGLLRNGIPTT